jgi:hypothetical protein
VTIRSVGKSAFANCAPPFLAENFLNLVIFSHNEAVLNIGKLNLIL